MRPPHFPLVTELTRTQYALILLPGFIAGRLCDLGYFKQTMFVSRLVVAPHKEYHLTMNSESAWS